MTASNTDTAPQIIDEPVITDAFGDDALGRVQGLLFGDHAQRTNERIDQLEQTMLDTFRDLRADIETMLAGVNDRFDQESEVAANAIAGVGHRLDQEVKAFTKADTALERKLEKLNSTLRDRLRSTAGKLADETKLLREELGAEIASQAQTLDNAKVDRSTLATLLRVTAHDLDGA